jgi:hypothetical protein
MSTDNSIFPFQFLKTPFNQAWEKGLFLGKYKPNSKFKWVDTDIPKNANSNHENFVYEFNEYGFRSDSFDDRSEYNILVSGCSLTVGIGVAYEDTWPMVLKKHLEKRLKTKITVWNLAQGGSSPEYVVRSIYKTIEVLKPNLIAICWPHPGRVELPDNKNKFNIKHIRDYLPGDKDYPIHLLNKDWWNIQMERNIIFLKMLCEKYDCQFRHGPMWPDCPDNLTDFGMDDNWGNGARDNMHPDKEFHKDFAQQVLNHWVENF